uniref:Uncharacterized protein n=1 Tax=Anguilla anguilla TaxID=7936 RepID=A0A0E9TV32_ANGAN
MSSTLILAGSRPKSSQNCWIPSIPILLSSWGSLYLLYSCSNFFLSSTPFKLCKYKSGFWKKLSVATSNFQSFCDKQLSAVFSLDCVKIMN